MRLALKSSAERILIVQITPNSVAAAPSTPSEIARRIEQIQFNATLNSELEALKLGKLITPTSKLKRLRIGRISAQEHFEELAEQSAGNLGWDFLERLKTSGRAAAELWLNRGLPSAAAAAGAQGGAPRVETFGSGL